MPAALAVLFYLISICENARRAAVIGFVFGMTFFVCGLWWIFGALSGYIGLPILAAAPVMLLLCVALSFYPALAAAVGGRIGGVAGVFAAAGAWAIAEWLRGILFSGFPWLAVAYSQPPQSPIYGFLPVFGVTGANLILVLLAALAAVFFRLRYKHKAAALSAAVVMLGAGGFLTQREWTTPVGEVSVSLLQGNVEQELKWREGAVETALSDYLRMAKESSAQWIILPETALPMRAEDLPDGYWELLQETAGDGAVLAGMFVEDDNDWFNAAVVIDDNADDYRKRHLTPYGEYLPFADVLSPILLAADIPYNNLLAGEKTEPLQLPGGRAAVSICYEDIFSNEWREQLPEAQVLINITNDGWFDGSAMLRQHVQMSQARAAEFGRFLARATNTGMTALIDNKGRIVEQLPPGEQLALHGKIILRNGATPYVRYGEWPALLSAVLLIVAAILFRYYRKETSAVS